MQAGRQATVCQLLTWTFSLSTLVSPEVRSPWSTQDFQRSPLTQCLWNVSGSVPSAWKVFPPLLQLCSHHPLHETFLDTLFKTVSLLLPSWFYFYPQHLPLSNIPHDWLTSFSYCMYLPTRMSLHECWFGLFRSAHYSQDLKECLLRSWCATHICWIN